MIKIFSLIRTCAFRYLKSLKDKRTFVVSISPRSSWMSCIFKEKDLKVLLGVLSGKFNCEFKMTVTMRSICTLPESSKSRASYYQLFIFGGFLLCHHVANNTYTLFVSNARILLNYHLKLLFLNKFKISISECLSQSLFNKYLAGNLFVYCQYFTPSFIAKRST